MSSNLVLATHNLKLGFCSALGLIISVYGYYVEIKAEYEPNYEALCDISEKISCTAVFSTEYGRGFGLVPEDSMFNAPNGLLGVIFFTFSVMLSFTTSKIFNNIHLMMVVVSNLMSMYLAYLLICVIQNLCVVCVSLYMVNGLNLYLCYEKNRLLDAAGKAKKRK